MKKNQIIFLFILCFSFSTMLFSENFRVAQMHIVDFSKDFSSSTTNVGINESIYIKYPEDTTFLEGFEIEIKIPKIKTDYDFIQMNIRTDNSEINYLLGIE
jgi:hypothetical protein